ncbi:MAG: hypothetical protein U5J63_01960 [Fodinibius sp.]|nr:hypothetical protein [Fodinibius sp.]
MKRRTPKVLLSSKTDWTAYPEDDMDAWQVTKQFDYGKNDEEVINPVENPVDLDNPTGKQQNLF